MPKIKFTTGRCPGTKLRFELHTFLPEFLHSLQRLLAQMSRCCLRRNSPKDFVSYDGQAGLMWGRWWACGAGGAAGAGEWGVAVDHGASKSLIYLALY